MTALRKTPPVVLFIAMEASWIVAVLMIFSALADWQGAWPLGCAVGLYPVVWVLFRFERTLDLPTWPHWALRFVVAGGLAAAAAFEIVGLPVAHVAEVSVPLALSLAATAFVVIRGWMLADREIDAGGFAAGFHMGVAVFVFVAVAQQASGAPSGDMVAALTVFLVVGLLGVWLARGNEGQTESQGEDQSVWSMLVILVIAAVPAIGVGLWMILDPAFMQTLLAPVFWLWDMLVAFLSWLIALLPRPDHGGPMEIANAPTMVNDTVDVSYFSFGKVVKAIALVMFYGSAGILLVMVLVRNLVDLMRWLSRRRAGSQGVAFEHSSTRFMDDLKNMIVAMVRAVRHAWRQLAIFVRRGQRDGLPRDVRSVRDLYARLLAWSAARGLEKPVGQTPHAFLKTLCAAHPDATNDFHVLTAAYTAVRYNDARPEPSTLRTLRAAWRRCRKTPKPRFQQ